MTTSAGHEEDDVPAWPESGNPGDDERVWSLCRLAGPGAIGLAGSGPTTGREIPKTRSCVVVSPDEMNAHR